MESNIFPIAPCRGLEGMGSMDYTKIILNPDSIGHILCRLLQKSWEGEFARIISQ